MQENAHALVPLIVNHAQIAANPPINPPTNITSPFYLHPRESPGVALVSMPLMEMNYYAWS